MTKPGDAPGGPDKRRRRSSRHFASKAPDRFGMSIIELYKRELTGRVGMTDPSVEELVLRQDKRAPIDGYSACRVKRVHGLLLAA